MAERHDIDITITNKGEVRLEVKGVDGPRCLDITKDIEEELGEVLIREKKSDYYKEARNTKITINGQGS